ncbi:MAG: DUF1573 domain-containing protein [Bacteroidales bacterium]|nr:DUF1573 domain-containing protein [Bacteroidales bacterium]
MKKILIILLSVIAMLPNAAEAKKKQAVAQFAETTYNFGKIAENGGPVTHEFEFTNAGDANLVIIDARADCGCTKPEFPAKPIAPGQKGKIKVTFNPRYQPVAFNKVVTLQTNGKQKKVRLKIMGTIDKNK